MPCAREVRRELSSAGWSESEIQKVALQPPPLSR